MPSRRAGFTVRVLRIGSAAGAGVGFVVDEQHIVTCAHVVNAALGRDQRAQDAPAQLCGSASISRCWTVPGMPRCAAAGSKPGFRRRRLGFPAATWLAFPWSAVACQRVQGPPGWLSSPVGAIRR